MRPAPTKTHVQLSARRSSSDRTHRPPLLRSYLSSQLIHLPAPLRLPYLNNRRLRRPLKETYPRFLLLRGMGAWDNGGGGGGGGGEEDTTKLFLSLPN